MSSGHQKKLPRESSIHSDSGLLDAYTDRVNSDAVKKHVFSKNKNQKKRESRETREKDSVSKAFDSNYIEESVVESWEDLETEILESKESSYSLAIETKKAWNQLNQTLNDLTILFQSPPQNVIENKKKFVSYEENKNISRTDKSIEKIKEEREAKKAAKKLGLKVPGTKKSETFVKKTRSERRNEQEAQRATKALNKTKSQGVKEKPSSSKASFVLKTSPTSEREERKESRNKVTLLAHLHQYERDSGLSHKFPLFGSSIHPCILQLGLQYGEGTIFGSNARCVSLLLSMKKVIEDYETPSQKELSRDLDKRLSLNYDFLNTCRSHSVSMRNSMRFLKNKINGISPSLSDSQAKKILYEEIDEYIHVNIYLASQQICLTAKDKMQSSDVILTYGYSSLMKSVLIEAFRSGLHFRVIVADGSPSFSGKQMVRHLVEAGIHCTYVLISATPYIMKEVTKVFVGAHGVLANGCVISRVGTSQVALIAKASNVPVLICCETYKFTERVQTDSFVYNELGDPKDLLLQRSKHDSHKNNSELKYLNLLNLTYDVTPSSFVDAIISEISVIPGTSVPVVLRLKNLEIH